MVQGHPALNEVILYDKRGSEKSLWGNLKFARRLAQKKFEVAVHLHATHRMHLVSWLARIPVRIGWRRRSAWSLTRGFDDHKREGKKHEAEYNFELLEPLGLQPPECLETFFPLTERAEKSLDQLLFSLKIPQDRPWVVLHPAASCPSKVWPLERFGQLAERVAQHHKVHFLLIGTRKDRAVMERVKKSSAAKLYDLSGFLSLGMLGHLLKRSALLISNDSGPVHVASAVGTPAISIFGRKQPGLSPRRWGPLDPDSRVIWKDVGCQECLAHRCQIHFLCLDAISVEDVLREVRTFAARLAGPAEETALSLGSRK